MKGIVPDNLRNCFIYTVPVLQKVNMYRYCVVVLLAACAAAIPRAHKHGHIGHGPIHGQPIHQGPGLQNNFLWNGINGGRRFTASGGHVSKSLTHHGKSIHVDDGRSTATATAHHDGTFSANVVPNQFRGGVHPGAVRPLGALGPFGQRGPYPPYSPYGHFNPAGHLGRAGRHYFPRVHGGSVHPGRRGRKTY
ncbi:uncharacterized protein LOC125652724 [Ostrea edulis]|uniref:uncharacterized protein LOC125652724 n=1 Tax=Ostrea edulis TaxID=37623 RepID=UPI00209465EC|nr:uncharacterized protein LOC125652724 [Ostrea edulis]